MAYLTLARPSDSLRYLYRASCSSPTTRPSKDGSRQHRSGRRTPGSSKWSWRCRVRPGLPLLLCVFAQLSSPGRRAPRVQVAAQEASSPVLAMPWLLGQPCQPSVRGKSWQPQPRHVLWHLRRLHGGLGSSRLPLCELSASPLRPLRGTKATSFHGHHVTPEASLGLTFFPVYLLDSRDVPIRAKATVGLCSTARTRASHWIVRNTASRFLGWRRARCPCPEARDALDIWPGLFFK